MKTILVTGAAGFIGSHAADALLARGDRVVGLDNINTYYDPARKRANVEEVRAGDERGDFTFAEGDFRDQEFVEGLFQEHAFDSVVHLGAMAGVRASIEDPDLYYSVNMDGSRVLLEAAVRHKASDGKSPVFVFASTSSVYGKTERIPFVEDDPCDRPLVPYSASKRAGEIMGFSYNYLHDLDFTAVRFFTVYGPRGRPDMMAYKVADSIRDGREVPLNNNGQMYRDWTYVGDIVKGVVAAADRRLGYEVINLGRGEPVLLADFVELVEETSGGKAHMRPAEMPVGDVPRTFADISKARRLLDYDPKISVSEGVAEFIKWHKTAT